MSTGIPSSPSPAVQSPGPTLPPHSQIPQSTSTPVPRGTALGENRLKPSVSACASASDSNNRTTNKVSVNRTVGSGSVKNSDRNIPFGEAKNSDKGARRDSCSSPRARRNSDTNVRKSCDSNSGDKSSENEEVDRLEKARADQEKMERERAEKERVERERVEKERQEKERLEQER